MSQNTVFEQFAEAVNRHHRPDSGAVVEPFSRITVLGGGADALLLSALFLSEGVEVTLFSAYGAELEVLRKSSSISLRGAGPVGVYQVDQEAVPSVQTTAELDRAVADAELVILTGPVHKQRTYAMALADHLQDGQVLLLAPGRSLGAAEAAWLLRVGGATADITIIEVQGLPYWYQASGTTLELSPVAVVGAATLPSQRTHYLDKLNNIFPNLKTVSSTVHSGFMDGSGLVEVPALVLGGVLLGDGGPDIPMGGIPLVENITFRSLIGREHIHVMEQMTAERHLIASRFGVRNLPSTEDWLDTYAGALKGEGARPVPGKAEATKMVRCATIGSLVPLVSAARVAGKAVPVTEAMITLVSSILGTNVFSAGRNLESIGVHSNIIEDARQRLDEIARGAHRHG